MRKLVVLGMLALSAFLSGCGYNTLQREDEGIKSAWSEVLNQYQRRYDLIPNLVNTVKGFAEQEKDVLLGVTNARASVGAIKAISGTIEKLSEISSTIAAAVEEQGAATQEIARNVEEAAKGTQEVSSNIGGVTEAANGTGAAAGQVLTAAQALTGQSGHLKDLVQTFLSDVKAA